MLDIFAIVLDGSADQRGGVPVAANKLGRRRKRQIKQIVEDQYLPVAIRPGANADGWNGESA